MPIADCVMAGCGLAIGECTSAGRVVQTTSPNQHSTFVNLAIGSLQSAIEGLPAVAHISNERPAVAASRLWRATFA